MKRVAWANAHSHTGKPSACAHDLFCRAILSILSSHFNYCYCFFVRFLRRNARQPITQLIFSWSAGGGEGRRGPPRIEICITKSEITIQMRIHDADKICCIVCFSRSAYTHSVARARARSTAFLLARFFIRSRPAVLFARVGYSGKKGGNSTAPHGISHAHFFHSISPRDDNGRKAGKKKSHKTISSER